MSLRYFRGDELPSWELTIRINGELVDFSGWDFTVSLSRAGQTTVTKTDGINGYEDGRIVVTWGNGELDIEVGTWAAQLTAQSGGGAQVTVNDSIQIAPRTLAEV